MEQINNHWLVACRQLVSPNANQRPISDDISLIVIHSISLPPGEYGGSYIDALFTNSLDTSLHPYFVTLKNLQVSAHLLIDRTGKMTQYVPFNQRAWHAGESSFQGRANCNDYAIGIELEGSDDVAYETVQYQVLASIVRLLMRQYEQITPERIVGHKDIAPGRKTDPGPAFDWQCFRDLLLPAP